MKPSFYLLALGLLATLSVRASGGSDPNGSGKKVDEVAGVVMDGENKKPLKDVTITAYFSTKKEKSVQTDESGNYSFDELKPGTYKLVFEKAGYKKVTREKVVVKADETFQLNMEMIGSRDFELVPSPFHFSDF